MPFTRQVQPHVEPWQDDLYPQLESPRKPLKAVGNTASPRKIPTSHSHCLLSLKPTMARTAYLALRDTTNMSPPPSDRDSLIPATPTASTTPPLLSLPRELRDQIYALCATPTPHTSDPLIGYACPATELLKVNKQLRAEYQQIFYQLLPDLLNSRRVCLSLPTATNSSSGSGDKVAERYCVGWHFWTLPGQPFHQLDAPSSTPHPATRRAVPGGLQIWIHRVPAPGESEVEWWMDVFTIGRTTARRAGLPPQVEAVEALLGRILRHGRVERGRLGRLGVVRARLRDIVEREREEREGVRAQGFGGGWVAGGWELVRAVYVNPVGWVKGSDGS